MNVNWPKVVQKPRLKLLVDISCLQSVRIVLKGKVNCKCKSKFVFKILLIRYLCFLLNRHYSHRWSQGGKAKSFERSV